MILKLVAVLLIFSFIVFVLKAIARLSVRLRGTIKDLGNLREQVRGTPEVSAEMVRCERCGAFVSSRDALTLTIRNRASLFCSAECLKSVKLRA